MPNQNKQDLKGILMEDANAGYIIRKCAGLEWELDLLLTRFFTADKRFDEFMDVIVPKFSFAEKISLIKTLKLSNEIKSREKLITGLEKFRRLRNILSHTSFIGDEEVDKIYSDNHLRPLFKNYPRSFSQEIGYTKNRLGALYSHYLSGRRKGTY